MRYVAWPPYVNRRIIDSTNVTVGDGAVQSDSIEGSPKSKRRMVVANPPDKFSVVMHFDCYEEMYTDADGNPLDKSDPLYGTTEKQRFFDWFKSEHKYGSNPVEFPSILWNSNAKTSFDEDDVARGKLPDMEHYIITSPVEGAKHGNDIEVKMTWETYATGIYEIPMKEKPEISSSDVHDGYAVIHLESIPASNVESTAFVVKVDNKTVASRVYTNEDPSNFFYIIFPKIKDDESHTVEIIPDESKVTGTVITETVRKGQ